MAAKKPKAPTPPKLPDDLRGVALVDAVIARIAEGKGAIEVVQPRPMRPEVIAALRFANGAPLPPSLAITEPRSAAQSPAPHSTGPSSSRMNRS